MVAPVRVTIIRTFYGQTGALPPDLPDGYAAYVRATSTTANRHTLAAPAVTPVRPFSEPSTAEVPYAGGKGLFDST
jgi:hypothetical protein